MMNDKLLNAYFAGLIDGEGCVNIYTYKSGAIRPVIKVNMTCEKTIKALHDYFGGHTGKRKTEPLPNRKQQWYWGVTYQQAITVCKLIRPYLITKADAADKILAFIPNKQGKSKRPRRASA